MSRTLEICLSIYFSSPFLGPSLAHWEGRGGTEQWMHAAPWQEQVVITKRGKCVKIGRNTGELLEQKKAIKKNWCPLRKSGVLASTVCQWKGRSSSGHIPHCSEWSIITEHIVILRRCAVKHIHILIKYYFICTGFLQLDWMKILCGESFKWLHQMKQYNLGGPSPVEIMPYPRTRIRN